MFFNVVCITCKLKCWILLMHDVTIKCWILLMHGVTMKCWILLMQGVTMRSYIKCLFYSFSQLLYC